MSLPGDDRTHGLFARVFAELKPRTAPPAIAVAFCRFANANSFIRLEQGCLRVRISDALQHAPEPVLEALAHILISKLYRKPVPAVFSDRYRRYLHRKDVRHTLQQMRQERGHKLVSGPQGRVYDLDALFDDLNLRHFYGLMAKPNLGWSLRRSRGILGHYDPSHHTIVLSRILDDARVDRLVVEYVLFHEMLHLRYPAEYRGPRRCVHTPEFKAAEKEFPGFEDAKKLLRTLA